MLALRLLRAVLCLPLGGSSREHPYIYAIPHCPLDLLVYLHFIAIKHHHWAGHTPHPGPAGAAAGARHRPHDARGGQARREERGEERGRRRGEEGG